MCRAEQTCTLPLGAGMKGRNSIYTSDYKDTSKGFKLVDSKTLDCRRDKFRNPDVSFMIRKTLDVKMQRNRQYSGKEGQFNRSASLTGLSSGFDKKE